MPLSVVFLVLLAAFLHAAWNAMLKLGRDRLLTITLIMAVGGLAVVPLLFLVPAPAPASWPYLMASAVLHLAYFLCLVRAYHWGDLSQVYPIARGAAPVLAAMGAALLAGERLGVQQMLGLLLASGAIASLAFVRRAGTMLNENRRLGLDEPQAVAFALGTGVLIGAYTVADGLGVRSSGSTLGYIAWLFFLDGLVLTIVASAVRRRAALVYLRAHWRPGLLAGLICALAYGLVIWALNFGAVAEVSALRETSVIFGAAIGSFLLRESFGARRIAAAVCVVLGVALLHLGA